MAALLMDVGLVSVPDEVLHTPPDKMNALGRLQFERHPVESERILRGIPGFEGVAGWVRRHHEREDGTGYPDRLRGGWLSEQAKVLATASTYASLILDDLHHPGLTPTEARKRLIGDVGGALEAGVVKVFLRVLDEQDENHAAAADDRFTFASRPAASWREVGNLAANVNLRPTGTDENN